MKVKLKTIFERYGEYVTGHIEDVEMYEKVKKGINKWQETIYSRITHIRIPKEIFERLLELDRVAPKSEGEWIRQKGRPEAICSKCGREVVYQVIDNKWAFENYCPRCGLKMKGGGE